MVEFIPALRWRLSLILERRSRLGKAGLDDSKVLPLPLPLMPIINGVRRCDSGPRPRERSPVSTSPVLRPDAKGGSFKWREQRLRRSIGAGYLL